MIIKIDLKSITIRCKKRMFCKAKRARTHRKLDNRTEKKGKERLTTSRLHIQERVRQR